MEEQLIEYKTAVLAIEKGFSNKKKVTESVQREYVDFRGDPIGEYYFTDIKVDKEVTPTQSLLQQYLRCKHNIIVEPIYNSSYNYYEVCVHDVCANKTTRSTEVFSIYEHALEKGLQIGLELIK